MQLSIKEYPSNELKSRVGSHLFIVLTQDIAPIEDIVTYKALHLQEFLSKPYEKEERESREATSNRFPAEGDEARKALMAYMIEFAKNSELAHKSWIAKIERNILNSFFRKKELNKLNNRLFQIKQFLQSPDEKMLKTISLPPTIKTYELLEDNTPFYIYKNEQVIEVYSKLEEFCFCGDGDNEVDYFPLYSFVDNKGNFITCTTQENLSCNETGYLPIHSDIETIGEIYIDKESLIHYINDKREEVTKKKKNLDSILNKLNRID